MKHKLLNGILLLLCCFTVKTYSQTPDFSLVGFATENGGTTGGQGGTEVVVTTFADLKKYAETKDTKYIIKIAGTITGSGSVAEKNYVGSIKVTSNKSIIGVDDSAFLDGVGFTVKDAKNIIIQNIKFSLISVAKAIPANSEDIANIYSKLGDERRPQILVNGGDLISVSGASTNIWIDHCEFYQEDPRVQTNQDLYDGLVDVKDDSGFITISWCYFHDHHKCSLIGSSDTNLFADRKITFHHNYYKTIQERVPLYRGAEAHFFNNYTYDVYSGIVNTRVNACVKVERNYFEKSKNTVYSKNSTILGTAEIVNNKEVDCTSSEAYPTSCEANIPYDYSTVLNLNADDVKNIVTTYSGVGKLSENLGMDEVRYVSDDKIAYPNPFHKTITVKHLGAFDYLVYNMAGVEIERGKSIDLVTFGANYPDGFYIVKLISDDGVSFLKIIKQ
ncbi:T9SS type A sorting domain-containing protein [Flavobacterium adhaerens]|uniref:pectate lyase family protein n=1 Tax=Flavobacterium adhaerens TaxID=3149043 RepID=UPI0032B61B8C